MSFSLKEHREFLLAALNRYFLNILNCLNWIEFSELSRFQEEEFDGPALEKLRERYVKNEEQFRKSVTKECKLSDMKVDKLESALDSLKN